MKKNVIAGNWKMNMNYSEVQNYMIDLSSSLIKMKLNISEVTICPAAIFLSECINLNPEQLVSIGAQDVSLHEKGAFTGEVSAEMLKSVGAKYCIVGHSERRKYHHETDSQIGEKMDILLSKGITPIICIGETEEQRVANETFKVINSQLSGIFQNKDNEWDKDILIAYEPVWAIGTGKTATPEIAQEVHSYIRNWINEKFGNTFAEKISILYGGSVKPTNISDLLAQKDIDGGLIGGASLDVKSMLEMINISENI